MSENHPVLPATTIDQALPLLARPFPPEAVSFKIQAQGGGTRERPQPTWAQVVGYLNARDVIGRLNQVAGGAWSAAYRPLDDELRPPAGRSGERTVWAVCELTVFGVCRSDVGEAEDSEHVRAPKGAYSDALKRAAVHFGIGHVLYAMPATLMGAGGGRADRLECRRDKLVLRPRNSEHLRACYREFLEQEGTRHFGAVLDDGARAGGVELEDEAADQPSSGRGEGPAERVMLAAERGSYSADVAAALAALMVGEAELSALDAEQAEEVAAHLERAATGGVAAPTLAGQLTKALNVRDREGARRRFAEWLERRAALSDGLVEGASAAA